MVNAGGIMGRNRLHYFYDPLCGWCHGAAPLIRAARGILDLRLHAGGMMAGERRQAVTPGLREYVLSHDRRIAQATGQPFGPAYTEGLLRDEGAVFDSGPPITAVLAAERLGHRGADLLARLQTAHYVEGRRIAEAAVLGELAAGIGLDRPAFEHAFEALSGAATQAHIQTTRALMARLGASGFPTLALERDGSLVRLDIAPYHGNLPAWEARLRQHSAAKDDAGGNPACGLDGCDR